MTARQQALQDDVQKLRSEILRALQQPVEPPLRVGVTAVYRLPCKWGDGLMSRSVQILRTPAGYEWREYGVNWHKKGRTAPAWRPL